jgi:hypothetical protein
VKECGKAVARRIHEPNFANRYFIGDGIDIGGAPDPLNHYASFFPRLRVWPEKNWVISVGCDSLGCGRNSVETQHVDRDHPNSV